MSNKQNLTSTSPNKPILYEGQQWLAASKELHTQNNSLTIDLWEEEEEEEEDLDE
jgi:hypothetical protein